MRARISTRQASPKPRPSAPGAGIGRRGLLLGGGQVALGALLLPACAELPAMPAVAPAGDPQPWSDGTWFDDGTGWIA